jgi:hypothetical protein
MTIDTAKSRWERTKAKLRLSPAEWMAAQREQRFKRARIMAGLLPHGETLAGTILYSSSHAERWAATHKVEADIRRLIPAAVERAKRMDAVVQRATAVYFSTPRLLVGVTLRRVPRGVRLTCRAQRPSD